MKNNLKKTTTNNATNATNATNSDALKNQRVLKSTVSYNTVKTTFTYNEKVSMIVAVMSDKQKVKSLIGSLKQSTAFNAFLCLNDVKTEEQYRSLWDNLKESLKEKGYKLAGSPLHKCFTSIWYLKSEQSALFTELTKGKDTKEAFLSLSSFLKSKELSFTLPVSRIKEALNGKTSETSETSETTETATETAETSETTETATETAETETTESAVNPIEQAIRLIRENVHSVTGEQANLIIGLLESQYLKAEKVA